MKVLLVDIGSTYTKVLCADLESEKILSQAKAFTTTSDVSSGLAKAIEKLELEKNNNQLAIPKANEKLDKKNSKSTWQKMLACSSANGGLKMIACGLVPELTAKAAKFATLSAGAKLAHVYSYELSATDVKEIEETYPDIVLLTGGTDGGNKRVIIENAKALAKSSLSAPIIVAGNKSAKDEIEKLFDGSGKEVYFTENVMPTLDNLNIVPCQSIIRDVFLKRIIQAKGITEVSELVSDILMPTPSAVLNAVKLLSEGTQQTSGLGEILVIDMGGATTDVYSACSGMPSTTDVVFRGLEEPYFKRTVEGDLGARYSLDSVLELDSELKNDKYFAHLIENPALLPQKNEEQELEDKVAKICTNVAVKRASGFLTEIYTTSGKVFIQNGKDLSNIKIIIGTGGPIINSKNPRAILECALGDKFSLMPKGKVKFLLDKNYIMASMGLLSTLNPEIALKLLLENLVEV